MRTKNLSVKPILNFFILLSFSLLIVFFTHISVLKKLELPQLDNYIILSYTINFILAGVIYLSLFFLKEKYLEQLGYLFLFGSFLKFIVFFAVFYPIFKAVEGVSRVEFFTFFIPYLTALIVETITLIKLLNPQKKED